MELLEVVDREKERLGRELHDGLCQSLAGIAALGATVAAADFTFTPATVTIHAGESVQWTGLNTHNVVFKTVGAPTDLGFVHQSDAFEPVLRQALGEAARP